MHRINSLYPKVSQWWIRAVVGDFEAAHAHQKALAADPNYKWTVRRRVVENGEKKLVEVTQKSKRGGVPLATKCMPWASVSDCGV
jgi:hypothetical protein